MAKPKVPLDIDEEYWEAVARCLVHFHRYKREKADDAIADFRRFLRKQGPEGEMLATHPEAFYTACDLAQHQIEIEGEYAEEYDKLIKELLQESAV